MNPDEQIATEELENQDLTPDEAAASLSFATGLQENMMMPPEMPEEAPETQETAPQEDITEETTEEVVEEPTTDFEPEPEAMEEEIEEEPEVETLSKDDFEDFKTEITKTIDTKIGDLTETIKDALKD